MNFGDNLSRFAKKFITSQASRYKCNSADALIIAFWESECSSKINCVQTLEPWKPRWWMYAVLRGRICGNLLCSSRRLNMWERMLCRISSCGCRRVQSWGQRCSVFHYLKGAANIPHRQQDRAHQTTPCFLIQIIKERIGRKKEESLWVVLMESV